MFSQIKWRSDLRSNKYIVIILYISTRLKGLLVYTDHSLVSFMLNQETIANCAILGEIVKKIPIYLNKLFKQTNPVPGLCWLTLYFLTVYSWNNKSLKFKLNSILKIWRLQCIYRCFFITFMDISYNDSVPTMAVWMPVYLWSEASKKASSKVTSNY